MILKPLSHNSANSSNKEGVEDLSLNPKKSESEWEKLIDRIKAFDPQEDSYTLLALTIYKEAMNRVSIKIEHITQNTDKLSSVMSDLLTLSTSLSKIQNQLGAKKEVAKEDWDKFAESHFNENHVERNYLTEIQSSYSNLIEDCKKLREADVADFKPIITAIEGVIDDFDTKIGDSKFSEDITKWKGDTSFQGDKRGTLQGDIVWLAKQFYEKNHDTDDNKGTVDYLSIWVQGINAAQQLGQGMSQQKVVDLQAQMQFISSFSSSGQQSAQSGKEELSVMVHNQAGR
ncbi:MAG: hypothetical protein ACRDDW_06415 [Candidatus Rhabdochlamydia sp.]